MRHSLWQSFEFAGRGLRHAIQTQRTMRIHVALAVVITVALVWLDLPVAEAAALVLAMGGVLAAELLNTAVEVLVDLHVGDQYHVLAGHAKDLSAAGVLVAAVGAAAVGLLVLGRPAAAVFGGQIGPQSLGRAGALVLVLALVLMVLRGAPRPGVEAGK